MDETHSADPPAPVPDDMPARLTRNTGAVATGLTPGESREYPEVPGYEILGILGHGGMGVVYRARQLGANRLVALKMIRAVEHATPARTPALPDRDRSRGALAASEHRAAPRSRRGARPAVLLAGVLRRRLAHRLAQEAASSAARIGASDRDAGAGDALRASAWRGASRSETGERPSCRLRLRGEQLGPYREAASGGEVPKITDFGLAKRIDAEARDVSQSGAIMGTASYMAPEQAAGKVHDTGPAADVYGLGALLYECLTGRPPFEGPQHAVLLSVLSDEPVPPSRLVAKVPSDLETICLKCLSKDPARRYGSAEELANDLRRFQADEPIRARPVGAMERAIKWATRHKAVAVLSAAVVLVTLLGVTGITWKYFDAEQRRAAGTTGSRQGDKGPRLPRQHLPHLGNGRSRGQHHGPANPCGRGEAHPGGVRRPAGIGAELVKAIAEVKRGIARRTPQAMILEVRGTVHLQSATGVKKAAVPQALVNLDDRLSLSADAQVQLVFLSDLHKERLKPGREVTIDSAGCEPADAVLERDDSVLMTFVRLPKGTFYMGWDGTKGSAKKTEIKEDFEIAVHHVTQGQWQAVMGDNPSYFSRKGNGRNIVLDISDEELRLFPVENVSWDDAQAFIKKLNEKERRRGFLYRLPTEAEWEYACRGGATSLEECSYHFYFDKPTNDLSSEKANFNGNYPFGKAPKGKYFARPTRVGAYPPNKLGLCDMHGNVWQWCADLLGPKGSGRVIRGGSWAGIGSYCPSAFRSWSAPEDRLNGGGFRVARVPVR